MGSNTRQAFRESEPGQETGAHRKVQLFTTLGRIRRYLTNLKKVLSSLLYLIVNDEEKVLQDQHALDRYAIRNFFLFVIVNS